MKLCPDEAVFISACLTGKPCRYDGRCCPMERGLLKKLPEKKLILCPEEEGGLPCPRPPAEISTGSGKVINARGEDLTRYFIAGARLVLEQCKKMSVTWAVLKSRSPSCGKGLVYSGKFDKTLISGNGVLTTLFKLEGIKVYTEEEYACLMHVSPKEAS